jgi:hypothetical protein
MNEIELLNILANHPAGIQVTLYPGRATIDLGYGDQARYEGKTLLEAATVAYDDLRRQADEPSH